MRRRLPIGTRGLAVIHQCYFAEAQRERLFSSPLYRGFGLYSSVNPGIARNCPELADPKNQPLLSEYAAMLHLWRNPELDRDSWIGFTSYRQLEKFPTILINRQALVEDLAHCDIVGWGFYQFLDAISHQPISLAEQGERCHPGITSSLWRLLLRAGETLPEHYLQANQGLFCNYWVMSRANFDAFMHWSFPLVQWSLQEPDPYVQSQPRSLSYLVERLFICWYLLTHKRLLNCATTQTILSSNPWHTTAAAESRTPRLDSPLLPTSWNVGLDEICQRHRVSPRGIVHVGAHYAEERDAYRRLGVRDVYWIEADPQHLPQLQAQIAYEPGHRAIQACLADVDGQTCNLFRTNNHGESSSILPMATHRDHFQHIRVVDQTALQTVTFASLVRRHKLSLDGMDFLVMDVQGAELMALRGFGDVLQRFSGIFLEVNVESLYMGCALLPEIDDYLGQFNFSRRETLLTNKRYGDALYLRTDIHPPLADLAQRLSEVRDRIVALRAFAYRCGNHKQSIELLPNGRITGDRLVAHTWSVRAAGHQVLLEFSGPQGRTCCLHQRDNGNWHGRQTPYTPETLELTPTDSPANGHRTG